VKRFSAANRSRDTFRIDRHPECWHSYRTFRPITKYEIHQGDHHTRFNLSRRLELTSAGVLHGTLKKVEIALRRRAM
jgi:hypothetical protein